jgi:hypothetical protein
MKRRGAGVLLQTVYTQVASACGGVGQVGSITFDWRVVTDCNGKIGHVCLNEIRFTTSRKAPSHNIKQLASVLRNTYATISKAQSQQVARQLWAMTT